MTTIALPRHTRLTTDFPLKTVILCACCLFVSAIACADDAANRLLSLVGEDAGLCVEIPRLEENLQAVRKSEFLRRLATSSLHQAWLQGEASQKLRRSRESIEKHTGKTIDQLIDEVFGHYVVIAIYSSSKSGAAGVLLTEADSVEALEVAISSWNAAEPQETITHEHAGHPYFVRSRKLSGSETARPLYYAKLDRVFALSDHEEMIQKVLDFERKSHTSSTNNVAENPEVNSGILKSVPYRRARQALSPTAFATAYLNPRIWDGVIPPPESRSPENQILGKIWRRLDSVALSVNLERGCVLETIVQFNGQGTPAQWQSAIERMQGSPEFLSHVPADAVALFAGRHDLSGLINLVVQRASVEVEQHQWESFRQVSRGLLLGLDLFDDVLPGLQPNWGGYLIPRTESADEASPATIPLEGLVAFEISSKPAAEEKAALRDALDNGLNTGMNLISAYFNTRGSKTPAIVRTVEQPGSVVRWIEGIPGYRPAYVLTKNHLAFASSPELAKQFNDSYVEQAQPHAVFDRCRNVYFPQENQISFIDVAALRKLLEQYRTRLVAKAAEANAISTQDCEERLSRLLDVAALVDSAFVAGHIDTDSLRLVIGGVVESTPVTKAEPAR